MRFFSSVILFVFISSNAWAGAAGSKVCAGSDGATLILSTSVLATSIQLSDGKEFCSIDSGKSFYDVKPAEGGGCEEIGSAESFKLISMQEGQLTFQGKHYSCDGSEVDILPEAAYYYNSAISESDAERNQAVVLNWLKSQSQYQGFSLVEKSVAVGQLTVADGVRDEELDVVFAVDRKAESGNSQRYILVVAGDANGQLADEATLSLSSESGIVYSEDEGGMMGDPFEEIEIRTTSRSDRGQPFKIGFWGGSAHRWWHRVTLQAKKDGQFYMIGYDTGAHNSLNMEMNGISVNTSSGLMISNKDYGVWESSIQGVLAPNGCLKYNEDYTLVLQPYCKIQDGAIQVGDSSRGYVSLTETETTESEEEDEYGEPRRASNGLGICQWASFSQAERAENFDTPVNEIENFGKKSDEIGAEVRAQLEKERTERSNAIYKCGWDERRVLDCPKFSTALVKFDVFSAQGNRFSADGKVLSKEQLIKKMTDFEKASYEDDHVAFGNYCRSTKSTGTATGLQALIDSL